MNESCHTWIRKSCNLHMYSLMRIMWFEHDSHESCAVRMSLSRKYICIHMIVLYFLMWIHMYSPERIHVYSYEKTCMYSHERIDLYSHERLHMYSHERIYMYSLTRLMWFGLVRHVWMRHVINEWVMPHMNKKVMWSSHVFSHYKWDYILQKRPII